MNGTERKLAQALIQTGRLRSADLEGCLKHRQDGEGLIDALVRQKTLGTTELESVLGDLRPEPPPSVETGLLADVVRRLDRYALLGELGRGATGCVFLTYDAKLRRSVALKVIPTPGVQDAARTRRELEIAASLQHPNIAAIYDSHTLDGYFIIAMQYIEGRPMGEARLSLRTALAGIAQAARAVHHAHEKGVVHRDLKPENLIAAPDGRVYVLDFGIARAMERSSAITRTGTIVGTPMFMSPEQIEGRVVDARTDVYSLGATLYELLARRPPFEADSVVQVLHRVLQGEPVPPRRHNLQIHRDVETIILKALSKDRERRYATAKEFAEDIERFLEGEPIRARPVPFPAKAVRYLARRPWAIATLAVVVLGLAAAAGLWWEQGAARSRMVEASRLVDEAARKIEDWDRFLYLPPRDLTPHRSLLDDAVVRCDEARRRAPIAAALHQKARALARLGRDEEADAAIGEALQLQPDGGLHLERARLRLQRVSRRAMEATLFILPALAARPRKRPALGADLLADLAAAQRLGQATDLERVSMQAIEQALQGDYERAEQGCMTLLAGAQPWQQAELHHTLAWARYLRYQSRRPAISPDAPEDEDLRKASEWAAQALDVRRCDAGLHLFSALLDLTRASRLFYGGKAEPLREAVASARRNAETALRIRPGDADGRVLLSNVHVLTVPLETWTDLSNASDEETVQRLREAVAPFLRRAEQEAEEAIATVPGHVAAWVQLSTLRSYRVQLTRDAESKEIDAAVETCTRCLALGLEPHLEAEVRSARAKMRAMRYTLRGMRGEADRRAAAEDVARLREVDPEEVDEFDAVFRELEPPK